MRKLSLIIIYILLCTPVFSQGGKLYQTGTSADQNLKAILDIAPYSIGGTGFDNRYQGVKGSPMLFDTLKNSFLKIKGKDNYIELKSDLDLAGNTLIFRHPSTGKLLSLPSVYIDEVVIVTGGKHLKYRTTSGINFEKELAGQKFFQVLMEEPYQFIKMTDKRFIEANYKGAYSADIRYDEFETKFRYFIMTSDGLFHQVQLTRKSLTKLFPDSKGLISKSIDERSDRNKEDMVLSLLEKL